MFSSACLFLVLTLISLSRQVYVLSDGNKLKSGNLQGEDYIYSGPMASPDDSGDLLNIFLLNDATSNEDRRAFLHQIQHSLWMAMKPDGDNIRDGFRTKRILGAFTRTLPSLHTKTNSKLGSNDYFNNLGAGRFGFFSQSSERPRPLRWG